LLIDADMRRPRLHHVFSVANEYGLSNLLAERAPLDSARLENACLATEVAGLHILTSGSSRSHASTLVHSPRLPELIALAREIFDMVIIDTPPMVNIADARVLGRLGDALILVVRSGVTTRDAAQLARTRFAEDGTAVLGTILNFWNPKTPGYSYYKYYYAGYYHYYGSGNGNGHGNGDSSGDGGGPIPTPGSGERPDRPTIPGPWKPGFVFRRQLGDGQVTQ
ncbi:MAG TPA: CpsD/CapB family tyrosine-protein kinase, partial [Vicinamibacterales bacterium]|nr:CpsD/CapB family tyrosine-protein kinase [Vicinamibacterales bacterium]